MAQTGLTNAVHTVAGQVQFQVPKRATPQLTIYSPVTGTSAKIRDRQNGADVTGTTAKVGMNGFLMNPTASGSATQTSFDAHWVAFAPLGGTADLDP
jgi:hypothetical protein